MNGSLFGRVRKNLCLPKSNFAISEINFIRTCLCIHHSSAFFLKQSFVFQSETEIFFHLRIDLEFIFKYLSCCITLVLLFNSPMLLIQLGVLDLDNHLPLHWEVEKKAPPPCLPLMLMSALSFVCLPYLLFPLTF